MDSSFYDYFCSATAGFVFSARQEEIPATISGEPHEREVKYLIDTVRRMAVKKSLLLPESFTADCDRDDWIQLAMITMFECCEKYDRKRPFDNYVRFMVARRLADRQRSLLRKNPPANREIPALYTELKKNGNSEEALARLAEDTGKSIDELRQIVASGVGARVFTSQLTGDDDHGNAPMDIAADTATPEEEVRKKQLHRILLQCMEQLSEQGRNLFQLHEFEELSFKKLFHLSGYRKSFAGFKRWYKSEIFEPVQRCVLANT